MFRPLFDYVLPRQPSAFWDMIGDPGVAARERNNLPLAYSGGGLSQPTPESHWMDG